MRMMRREHSAAARHSAWVRSLAVVYLVLAVLGPWINIGAARGIRPEEAVLPLMVVVYLSGTGFSLRLSRSLRLVLVGLAAIAACISLSLLANMPRSGGGPVARDTLELVRVAKYAAVMLLAGYDSATARACRKWFVILVLVATAIAFVQVVASPAWVYSTMSVVDPSSAKFYASQNIAAGLRRVTGSFGNPNNFGVFLSASVGLLIGLFASSSKRGDTWLLGSALVAVCAAVVATQSFTGLFALGLVLLVGCVATFSKRQYRKRGLALLMAVAIAIGTFAGILGVFGSEGFVIGRRLTNASYAFGTMSSRFMVWTSVAMNMASDPAMLVFGMGPQKESETRVVGGDIDSDYVTILKRYGLIGFLCFGLFVTSVVAALRIPALVETGAAQGWRFGAVLMLLVILVSDLTNVVYVNNQLMDVFMFLLGSALSSDRDVTEQLFGFRDSVSRPVGSRARSSKLAATMERP
jgi:O-antigen ligase